MVAQKAYPCKQCSSNALCYQAAVMLVTRIHLRTTHYLYAQHLEASGDIKAAMQHYQASHTAAVEVPRMLYQLGHIDELEQYVMQSGDNELLIWWAKYRESQQQYDQALKCYQRAGKQNGWAGCVEQQQNRLKPEQWCYSLHKLSFTSAQRWLNSLKVAAG